MDAPDAVDPMLEAAWPVYALRLRTERLVLRLPTVGEILEMSDVARAGIHPPGEMPFGIAWTDVPDPEFGESFVRHHMDARRTWRPTAWALHLMVIRDGRPIGSQSLLAEAFPTARTVSTGSWLGRASQGQGLGTEMRAAVLGLAFDGLGAGLARSEAFLDNPASAGVSRSIGYAEDGLGELAPRGEPRPTRRYMLSADAWRSRARPAIAIEGLDACRSLFGA